MDACFGASFRHIDANLVKTVYTGRDPRTGLLFSVEGLRYLDFPVVEWVVWLRNDNAADTPVIGALRVCDAAFPSGSSSLWSSWGDTCVTRTVNSYLLDLGNDEAQRWLTDFLCDFIQMHGVKIYRQDFNFPPLTCWNANEAEDRQGFLENRHVQGCLAFWDALLERNHGLSIDSCAAGAAATIWRQCAAPCRSSRATTATISRGKTRVPSDALSMDSVFCQPHHREAP